MRSIDAMPGLHVLQAQFFIIDISPGPFVKTLQFQIVLHKTTTLWAALRQPIGCLIYRSEPR